MYGKHCDIKDVMNEHDTKVLNDNGIYTTLDIMKTGSFRISRIPGIDPDIVMRIMDVFDEKRLLFPSRSVR